MEFKHNEKVNVLGFFALKYPQGGYVKDVYSGRAVIMYKILKHKYFNLFSMGDWIAEDCLFKSNK